MKKLILAAFVSAVILSSCDNNEHVAPALNEINGNFSSTEVEIIETKSQVLPAFNYNKVVDLNGYTLKVSSTQNDSITSWDQNLSSSFSYETSTTVEFSTSKDVDLTLPKADYTLTGSSVVNYGTDIVTIDMSNTQYAAISIYNQFVDTAYIANATAALPTMLNDSEEVDYYYSFVQPQVVYNVTVVDIQGYTHNVDVTAEEVNDNSILYLVQNDIDGGFNIVYEWETIPVIINPEPTL